MFLLSPSVASSVLRIRSSSTSRSEVPSGTEMAARWPRPEPAGGRLARQGAPEGRRVRSTPASQHYARSITLRLRARCPASG